VQRLVRLRNQDKVEVEVKVGTQFEAQVEIERTTQLPMLVSTQPKTGLRLLPDEQREVLREAQSAFGAGLGEHSLVVAHV